MSRKRNDTPAGAEQSPQGPAAVSGPEVSLGSLPTPEREDRAGAEPSTADAAVGTASDVRRVAYCHNLNLRCEPGRDAAVLAVIPAGTPVVVDSARWVGDGVTVWMPVTMDGRSGWVCACFLAAPEEG